MSEPIGIGDVVECIETFGPEFAVGSLYTVADINPEAHCTCMDELRPWAFAHIGLTFSNAADPPTDRGKAWCVYMFRPISRRSSFERVLEELKRPAPEKDAEWLETDPSLPRPTKTPAPEESVT